MQETQHTQQIATEQHKSKHGNDMNINSYKNKEDSQKQETNIYLAKYWSIALERSATKDATGGLNQVCERSTSPSSYLSYCY